MAAIEIFRPGRHQSSGGAIIAFGAAEVAEIAAGYDPELHEAPVVVGHPAHDKPAYGWVKGLVVRDGGLFADLGQVDPNFAELVRAGRFKKISASFYQPGASSNPKPGAWYLRHVGFLGAQPPSVKGLKPAQFGDAAGLGVISFAGPPIDTEDPAELGRAAMELRASQARNGVKIDIAAAVHQVRADGAVHHAEGGINSNALAAAARNHMAVMAEAGTRMTIAAAVRAVEKRGRTHMADKDTAAQADLDARKADLDAREAAFAERERQANRKESEAFCEGLLSEGKLTPGMKPKALALMDYLSGVEVVEFAEGEDQTTSKAPLDYFRDFLKDMPKVIEFREVSNGSQPDRIELAGANAARAAELGNQARAFQEAQAKDGRKVDIAQSVRHLTGS